MNYQKTCIEVLIPTYNRAPLLARALESVRCQTHSNLKISVIDNASTDNTNAAVTEFMKQDPRINYIRHDQNIGMLGNINYMFSIVTEEFFCVLTDDDYYAADFLEQSLGVLNANEELSFVALKSVFVDDKYYAAKNSFHVCEDKLVNIYSGLESFKHMMAANFPLSLISVLYKKPLAEVYLENTFHKDVGADINFFLICSARYTWATLNSIGAFVWVHEDSYSVSKNVVNWNHSVIMNLRLVNIIDDTSIAHEIRVYAKQQLINSINSNPVWYFFRTVLRKIVLGVHKGEASNFCEKDIVEFSYAKKRVLTGILRIINDTQILRYCIRILLHFRRTLIGLKNALRNQEL